MGQKQPQQLKFLEGQRHPLALRRDGVAVQIQRYAAAGKPMALLGRGAAPQHCLDAGDHLHHAEGLYQIVVGPHVETLYLVVFHALGGGHDDGHRLCPGCLTQIAQQRHAVLSGQHHVQQHQLRRLRFQRFPEAGAVGKATGLKTRGVQRIYLDLADAGVILHTPDHVNSSPL